MDGLPHSRELADAVGSDHQGFLGQDKERGVKGCRIVSQCVRAAARQAARTRLPTVLLVDAILVRDVSQPVVVVNHRGALRVTADKVLIDALDDLQQPVGERRALFRVLGGILTVWFPHSGIRTMRIRMFWVYIRVP